MASSAVGNSEPVRTRHSNVGLGFVGRRLAHAVLVLAGILVTTFLLVRLIPGDPAANVAGITASPEIVEQVRRQLGLDVGFGRQFVNYIAGLIRGDLGVSFYTHQAVGELLSQRAWPSIQFAVASLLLVLLLSIPGGLILAALTRDGQRKSAEFTFTTATSVLAAVPEFLMAIFLVLVFSVWLNLLPAAGQGTLKSLILPVLAVSIRPIGILMRMVRMSTLGALTTDYVRTAEGKRLPQRVIYLRHVLPNVVASALTVGGLLFPGLVGAAVVVENIFARAGLGTALVKAVIQNDYPVIQGCILVLGIIVVTINILVDFMVAAIDPRALTMKAS